MQNSNKASVSGSYVESIKKLLVQKQMELQKKVDEFDELRDQRSAEVYHNYKVGIEFAIKTIDELPAL